MAEIKIEKKKPIWPWIILVLVILAILYFLVFADDEEDEIEMDETEQIDDAWDEGEDITTWDDETDTTAWDTDRDTLGGTGSVNAYLSHVADTTQMGVDHEYTNTALIHLMNAVEAKANEMNFDITADMQEIRQDAQAIEEDPTSENHADRIRQAGTKLATVIERMQQENFPDLSQDVQEMKTAANGIDGAVPTLEQREQVKSFFEEAADVLRKMS